MTNSEPETEPIREKQPRCNICGRFAYWDSQAGYWQYGCTSWNGEMGAYDHE